MNKDHHKLSWTIEDLIDFEYYRMSDEEDSGEDLEVRDRTIFREYTGNKGNRPMLFRFWLEQIRGKQKGGVSPGSVISPVFAIVSLVMNLTGLISGISIAFGTLQYDGTVPVNVATFFGFLVAPQMILTLLLVGFVVAGMVFRRSLAVLYLGPRLVVISICRFVWNVYLRYGRIGAEKQDDLLWSSRVLSEIIRQNRGVVTARVFRWIQSFGVFFNIGVLLCAGVLLMFSDRAFGWQSSLTDSPEIVGEIVSTVALPWQNWLGEGVGYPSPDQIAGSHIVLRDRATPLDADNLTSWWPFLLLGIVCYGLVPRLLAWGIASLFERRSLRDLRFESMLYQPLWERMHSTSLQSSGTPVTRTDKESVVSSSPVEPTADRSYHLWHSLELKTRYSLEAIVEKLRNTTTLDIKGVSEYSGEAIGFRTGEDGASPLILLEGWQPPIQEVLNQLKTIAQSPSSREKVIYLLLIGKPLKTGWRAVTPEMVEVWNKKVRLLGVDNLHLHKTPMEGMQDQ